MPPFHAEERWNMYGVQHTLSVLTVAYSRGRVRASVLRFSEHMAFKMKGCMSNLKEGTSSVAGCN